MAGTDAHPAIAGFDPGQSADELYVTNGEPTDYADKPTAHSFTPELDEGCDGCGFVFPDDEAAVQAEFVKTLPFALSLATSADDPGDAGLGLGATTKPFYLSQTESTRTRRPADVRLPLRQVSYGDPQDVAFSPTQPGRHRH